MHILSLSPTTRFHAAPYRAYRGKLRKFRATYRQGTMFALYTMFISKGSYGNVEPKNVNPESVQTAYRCVRASKLPGYLKRRIGPTMEICVNLGLPIAKVPWLHENNVRIKRKLWGWRAYKCKPWVGAQSAQTCMGVQTSRFYLAPYRADNGNLRKFGVTYRYGTMFAPKECLYQKEAMWMESL